MKILSIHNEYLIKGGEDESRKAEVAILEEFGNSVTSFIENNAKVSQLSKVSVALRTLWSQDSYKYVKQLLRSQKHDVMHVQNFFPLISPSVYYAAKSENVPVVQAVRNYRLICPSATMYRDGQVCDTCVSKSLKTPAILHKCYRDNRGATTTVTTMLAIHKLLPTWKQVDAFICISQFIRQKMIDGGFPVEKIYVKPNFVYPDPGLSIVKEDYVVYVGRLQTEKGIEHLLEAHSLIGSTVHLKIIGEGPLAPEVISYSKKNNVEYLGKLSLLDTYDVIGKARILVIPSVWHEPFGRVVVEAYAKGTAVIGSRMGGIPELIEDGVTGYTYEGGNAEDLAKKIEFLYQNPQLAIDMGLEGRKEYLKKYTPKSNYDMMMAIYSDVIQS
ncbi:glycosyltransferase family 4 protein [Larkinella sp. GY13]|uniref:glycosyltransferase family 4 protein n=1 Tax=Larkinella sp. GY13 TaxID=3453720 RepID=UPI003EECE4D5